MIHDNAIALQEYDGFLSEDGCKAIICMSENLMDKAQILGDSNDEGYRIADTMFFEPDKKELKRVRQSIAKHINLPVDNLEHISVIRYKDSENGVFKPHYDTFFPDTDYYDSEMAKGGQRVKTCLIYLNEGFEGGDTDFPYLGYRITPKTGKLVIWNNVDNNNRIIHECLHEGMQVTKGIKFVLTIWVRERTFTI